MSTEGKCDGKFTKSGNFLIFVLFCLVVCVRNRKISNHGSESREQNQKAQRPCVKRIVKKAKNEAKVMLKA